MTEHRCRSCLWFAEPLWPEHRPACMWAPRNAPPWAHQRHYVTSEKALTCKAFEDAFEEVEAAQDVGSPQAQTLETK